MRGSHFTFDYKRCVMVRLLKRVRRRVWRWIHCGRCVTCGYYTPTIGRGDDRNDPGTDGHCANPESEFFGIPVYRRTYCTAHTPIVALTRRVG